MSDIDTEVVDSLKTLDPNWPIREADKATAPEFVRFWTIADIAGFWGGMACPLMTQSGHGPLSALLLNPIRWPFQNVGAAMRRRDFITVLGGAAAASALSGGAVAQAVPSIFRIGIVSPAASKSTLLFETFRARLKELGYVEDRDIVIEFRLAAGAPEKVPALAADLVRQPVDVLVADGAHVIGVLQGLTSLDATAPHRCPTYFELCAIAA